MTRPAARSVRAVAASVAIVAVTVLVACAFWLVALLLLVILGVSPGTANGWATLVGLLGASLVLVAGLSRGRSKQGGQP